MCRPAAIHGVESRNVMLALLHRGQAHVTACLARHLVAVAPEQDRQLVAAEISRQPHAGTTSSRTACRRIRSGCSPSSKWHCTASRMAAFSSSHESASVKIEWPKARAIYPPSSASSTKNSTSRAMSPYPSDRTPAFDQVGRPFWCLLQPCPLSDLPGSHPVQIAGMPPRDLERTPCRHPCRAENL